MWTTLTCGRCRSSLLLSLLGVVAAAGADVYVAPTGDDAGPGTRERPFATIRRATEALEPGDTCWLAGGVYRETVRPARSGGVGRPIRFAAMPGERVIVSGSDPLPGDWQPYEGRIYRLATDRKFIQLFVDGRMMPEARWPNAPLGDLMACPRATAGPGTDKAVLADPSLPPGDWNGAVVLLWPGDRWTSATRRVTEYRPGVSLRFDADFKRDQADPYHSHDPYSPRPGNPYVLYGALAGLDSPGEWFLDQGTGTLYLWTPEGDSPARHIIEVRQRDYAFDLSGLSHVEVTGLDLVGAAVNMTDSQSCLLENCRLRYVQHVREWPKGASPPVLNTVTGRGNTWRRCLVAYAGASAVRVAGEGNRLENCVIHDMDYAGSGTGGVSLNNSVGAVVSRCSIFRSGRDLVTHHGSRGIRLDFNDLYHGNMLNNDAGAIYCWGTAGDGGVIAHNWVHDNLGDATCGIYLDNFSRDFVVHHNVVWNCTGSAIRLNSDALNHLVANNTICQVEQAFGTYTYAAYTPTMAGTRILNNLVNAPFDPKDPGALVQGELGPVLGRNASAAVDRDAVPVAGSAAVDAGEVLPGLTAAFVGAAPDLGAYEAGGERWVAGADWSDPEAPQPPARDLSFVPHPPVTRETMIRDGLVLWLDAAARECFDRAADGSLLAWRDARGAEPPARAAGAPGSLQLVPDALNGKPVVRGSGTGCLRVGLLTADPGPLTILVVSQGTEATGPSWQRIAAASRPTPEEWVSPNWIIMRPGGENPEAYSARLFVATPRPAGVLDRLTILGASATDSECLAGDVAEVLVYERALRFDELQAITAYLTAKWGLDD